MEVKGQNAELISAVMVWAFFISNKSHMSVSKPSHGQFLFLFSERGKRIKTCAVDPLVYIQKKSAS